MDGTTERMLGKCRVWSNFRSIAGMKMRLFRRIMQNPSIFKRLIEEIPEGGRDDLVHDIIIRLDEAGHGGTDDSVRTRYSVRNR